jgi:PAS domain S-box-containing protein
MALDGNKSYVTEGEISRLRERITALEAELAQARVAHATDSPAGAPAAEQPDPREFIEAISGIAPVVLYVFDLSQSRTVWVNSALPSILGYTPGELQEMGETWVNTVLHPEDVPGFHSHIESLRRLTEGETAHFEYRIRHKNGTWVGLASDNRVFRRDADGNVVQIVGAAQDITRRGEAELASQNSTRLLQTIVESTTDLVWVKDEAGRITFGNHAAFALLGGGDPRRVLGYGANELIPDADHATRVMENDNRVMRTGQAETVEEEFGPPADPFVFQSIKAPLRDVAGTVVGVVGVSRDITERKRTERALREGEERQRYLLRLSDALRSLSDPTEIQSAAATILGEHLKANRVLYAEIDGDEAVVHQDYVDGVRSIAGRFRVDDFGEAVVGAYRRGEVVQYADIPNDGRLPASVRESFAAIEVASDLGHGFLKGGQWVAALAVHQSSPRTWTALEISLVKETAERTWDAVERARSERALRHSQATLQSFYDSAPFLMGLVELDNDRLVLVSANRAVAEFVSTLTEDLPGQTAQSLGVAPEIELQFVENCRSSQQQDGAPVRFECEFPGEFGSRWLSVTVVFVGTGWSGNPRFSFVAEDCTARREAEERERAAIAKFQTVFHQSGTYGAILDQQGNLLEVNDLAADGCGYSREELLHRPFWETPWWRGSEEVKARIQAAVEAAAAGAATHEVLRFWLADGSERTAECAFQPVRDGSGSVRYLHATGFDITERVHTESALRQSEQRLRLAKAAAGLGIYDFDPRTGSIEWDDRVREIWGIGASEPITYDVFMNGLHPDDRAATQRSVEMAFDPQGDGSHHAFYRVIHRADGRERWVEATGQTLFEQGRGVRVVGTVQDVTERKQIEQSLLLAAERAEVAQRAASAILFEIRPRTGEVFRSHLIQDLVGYTNEEVSGNADGWRALVDAEDHAAFDEALAATLTNGTDWSLEYRVRHKRGSTIWVSDQARVVRNERGEIERVVGMVCDITKRKQVQQALEESEARFRTMADASPNIIWVTNAEGELEFINQAYRDFCAVTDDDVRAKRWQLVVHLEDRDAYIGEFARCIREQRPFYAQCRIRRSDGAWRWIASYASPWFSAEGKFLGHVGSSPDIHELITTQRALRESEERFRTLADNMSQLAWMTDENGWIFWYNQRWYDYTGTTLEQMEGWGWREVHHPDHVERVVEHIRHCFETGEPWEDTFPLRGRNGEFRWFLSRAVPIRDDTGRVLRWFGTNTDITRQLETEEQLRQANQDLEQFAYSVSHDLQEPLRNVALYAQLLQGDSGAPGRDVERSLRFIVTGAERMQRLITDLLEYMRAAAKDDTPVPRTDGNAVFELVLHSLAQGIRESQATVTCDGLPPVYVRQAHLQQLLQNLISNALKYRKDTEAPRIHVTARRETGMWCFSVTDNGIGIAPEYHEKVFGVLRRLHGNSRKYSGSGIGLAICQRIVEGYGGRIWVQSTPGAGSSFSFTLPYREEPGGARAVSG